MQQKILEKTPETSIELRDYFTERFKETIKWVPEIKNWAIYENNIWKFEDKSEKIYNLFAPVLEQLEAKTFENNKIIKELYKANFATLKKFDNFCSFLKIKPEFELSINEFDANPYLLNCPNGVYDLINKKLLKHKPEYYFTKITGAEYKKDAECPVFQEFINSIMGNDEEMKNYILNILSSTLAGTNNEQTFYQFIGNGGNGKTTLNNIMLSVLNNYANNIDSRIISNKVNVSLNLNDYMRLRKLRYISFSELNINDIINEKIFKNLTGQDYIGVKQKKNDFKELSLKIDGKILFFTNVKPNFMNSGPSIRRRNRIIEMNKSFLKAPDKLLSEKLLKEKDGILSYLLKNYKKDFTIPSKTMDYSITCRYFDKETNAILQKCMQISDEDVLMAEELFAFLEIFERRCTGNYFQTKYVYEWYRINSKNLGKFLNSQSDNGYVIFGRKKIYKNLGIKKEWLYYELWDAEDIPALATNIFDRLEGIIDRRKDRRLLDSEHSACNINQKQDYRDCIISLCEESVKNNPKNAERYKELKKKYDAMIEKEKEEEEKEKKEKEEREKAKIAGEIAEQNAVTQ